MSTLSLVDGTMVACRICDERHRIAGFQGNNLEWTDDDGWGGSFDVAHGPFDSLREANTLCPKCAKLSQEAQMAIISSRADELVAKQERKESR